MVRGTILCQMGRSAEGIESYDRAGMCDPAYTPALLTKAIELATSGRLEEAAACCDEAVERASAGGDAAALRTAEACAEAIRETARDLA